LNPRFGIDLTNQQFFQKLLSKFFSQLVTAIQIGLVSVEAKVTMPN
jgi:hypothetical protein